MYLPGDKLFNKNINSIVLIIIRPIIVLLRRVSSMPRSPGWRWALDCSRRILAWGSGRCRRLPPISCWPLWPHRRCASPNTSRRRSRIWWGVDPSELSAVLYFGAMLVEHFIFRCNIVLNRFIKGYFSKN